MADGTETIEAPVQTTTTTVAAPVLLAGKYADQPALEKGIREARKAAGFEPLPDKLALIGETGMFGDVAAAEREYKRLDAVLTQSKQPKADATKPADAAQSLKLGLETLPDTATDEQVLERAGFKGDEIGKQWLEHGALTDEQYAKITEADKDRLGRLSKSAAKQVIDQRMELKAAKAELEQHRLAGILTEVHTLVGGKDKWDALKAGAPRFVPADEMPDIEARLQSTKHYKGAVRDLLAFHAASIGAAGAQPIINGTTGGSNTQSIKTASEYFALQKRAMEGEDHLWPVLQAIDVNKLSV